MAISRTAFGVAYHRYAHLHFDGEPRILDDHLAAALLGPERCSRIAAERERFLSPLALGLRSHVLARSRYAEDHVETRLAEGAVSVVNLGAGLDTSALRLGARYPKTRFVEVDQPSTQNEKRNLLAEAGIAVPPNVTFLPVDFENQNLLDELAKTGLGPESTVIFLWLGVTMYLTKAAIGATLGLCSRFAAGSQIVFTYTGKKPEPSFFESASAAVGEEWKSKFSDGEVLALLRDQGFREGRIVPREELQSRYFEGRRDGLAVSGANFIAIGTV